MTGETEMAGPVQTPELVRALAYLQSGYRRVVEDALDSLWETLRFLVAGEDEPCWHDHHGYCQEHHAGEIDGVCAVAHARRLVGLDAQEMDGVEVRVDGTEVEW